MDEPSRGIDVGAKADVFRTMRRLAAKGLGILFVTSDLEEVMALSDRIAVMSNGRVTALFDAPRRPRPRSSPPRRSGTARRPRDAATSDGDRRHDAQRNGDARTATSGGERLGACSC